MIRRRVVSKAAALLRCRLLPLSIVAMPLGAQDIRFERINATALHVGLPGVAVIRDAAAWTTLWKRFEQLRVDDSGRVVRSAVPSIDFSRRMLVAVDRGGTSGCGTQPDYVHRVVDRRDSVLVFVGHAFRGVGETCMMYYEPIDVVAIPRTTKPIAFRAEKGTGPLLPPAIWWRTPTVAELERMPEHQRGRLSVGLANDPATPREVIEALVRRSRKDSHILSYQLFGRSDVRQNPSLLIEIAQESSLPGANALSLLFREFGSQVGGDSATPRKTLEQLINKMGEPPTPQHREVGARLVENPAVFRDKSLLASLIRRTHTRQPDVSKAACVRFLARWSAWEPNFDSSGKEVGRTEIAPCP